MSTGTTPIIPAIPNSSSSWIWCPCGDVCHRAMLKLVDALALATTGLTPLERLLTEGNLLELLLSPASISTSVSVNCSTISQIEALLNKSGINSSIVVNSKTAQDATGEIIRVMSVHPKYISPLVGVIRQIRTARKARDAITAVQRQPVDPTSNEEHIQMLHQLWSILTGDRPPPVIHKSPSLAVLAASNTPSPLIGEVADVVASATASLSGSPPTVVENSSGAGESCWTDIGFQGHPIRDFRGVGLLGLVNLLYFACNHTARAKEVFQESCTTGLWFPFVATGLNISSWLLSYLEDGKLSVFFFNNTKNPLDIFGIVYSFVFLEFSRFWRLSRPKDIMQFGQVANRFLWRLECTLKDLAASRHHSEWNVQSLTGEDLCEELSSWIDGEVHPHQTKHLFKHIMSV